MANITLEQFRTLVKAMWAIYPKATFIPDEEAFKVWYTLLSDIPYETLAQAVQAHLQSNKFPPTPADIREQSQHFLLQDEEMYRSEGWAAGLVMKAARNSTYGAEEEFAKLPPLVQEAVGSVEALRSLGALAPDVLASVAKGQFLSSYRARVKAHAESQKFTPYLREQMDKVKRMALGEDYDKKPELDAGRAEQPLLIADAVSFQELPDTDENDSEAAAAIRASMHERIQLQAIRQAEEERQRAIAAEQAKMSEDTVYREFVEYAGEHGMTELPSKSELLGFYGLKAGVEFDRVIGLIQMMRG